MQDKTGFCLSFRLVFSTTCALMLLFAGGCQQPLPEMGTVSGVVTLDGKPQPLVKVVFSPDPSAGPAAKSSQGLTDGEGRYSLSYRSADGRSAVGAKIGKHLVSMKDIRSIESRDNPVPYRFSLALTRASKSPLFADVKAGEQQIDFDITPYKAR
jgi:hypothetical protein